VSESIVLTLSFRKLAMSSGVMSKVVVLGALAVPVSIIVALPLLGLWSTCFFHQSLA